MPSTRKRVSSDGRVAELRARLAGADGVQILDVRERAEWEAGRIPGSTHVPYHDLDGVPDGLDAQRPIAAICESGQRSAVAASIVAGAGARQAIHVVPGGVGTWRRLGGTVVEWN